MAKDKNPFVGIAGVLGGISVAIVAIVVTIANNQAWILAPIIGALAVMGIFLGFAASRKK